MIEKEMGYRGSKSNKGNTLFVKEQRVDGSYVKKLTLRYTLTGFERNYQVKIFSPNLSCHVIGSGNFFMYNFWIGSVWVGFFRTGRVGFIRLGGP